MASYPMSGDSIYIPPTKRRVPLRDQLTPLLFSVALTATLTLILSLNIFTSQQISLQQGETAPQTILAPQSLTYDSPFLTAQERRQAVATIFRYTTTDRSIGREQTNKARAVFLFIEVVRADAVADVPTRIAYLQAIEPIVLDAAVAELLLSLSSAQYGAAKNEVLRIVAEVMQQDVRADNVSQAQEIARRLIGFEFTTPQEQLIGTIAPQFIVPNVFFDEVATTAAREEASTAVKSVRNEIRADEIIIQQGEVVSELQLEELERLGLLRQGTDWYSLLDAFIVSLIASTAVTLYWSRFQRRFNRAFRYLFIMGVLLLLFVLAARLMASSGGQLLYFFPATALFMLLTVIVDARLSVMVAMVVAIMVGFMSNNSLEASMYTAVGGILAILTLRDTQRFYAFFRAGMISAVGNILVLLLFHLGPNADLPNLGVLLFYGFINGALIAPVVTIAGFFFVGLLGVITVVQLQDLSRLDHPLLKELLRKAPGTYHHSIMVANLAEQAAERVDANSTLVRVGAFYHDIGKMNRPSFFTENQEGASTPHETLDPYSSARIILAHVPEGVDLARKYRIPNRIQDFIAEHHGDRIVKMFYEKARAAAGAAADEVDLDLFRYKGRRPRSRETGIVLLADTVEAASSAVRPSTAEEIEKLVNNLVDDHLKEGQLDDSELTMGDLKQIRASFIETLKGRFHVRVRYPGNEELVGREESGVGG